MDESSDYQKRVYFRFSVSTVTSSPVLLLPNILIVLLATSPYAKFLSPFSWKRKNVHVVSLTTSITFYFFEHTYL